MQVTNFDFTQEETTALSDVIFFLLKNTATKKIVEAFGAIERDIKQEISNYDFNMKDLNVSSGKIFRGENYNLYPYIVLDCPRLFSTETIFAFRTMFWWGHEFSFTLHLQGAAFDSYRNNLGKNIESLYNKNVFYCVNHTPWQYNFEEENYLPIEKINDLQKSISTKPFIKLSRKLPVKEFQKVHNYCLETLHLFIKATQ